MNQREMDYFSKRAGEEELLASVSSEPSVKAAHAKLAAVYRDKMNGGVGDAGENRASVR